MGPKLAVQHYLSPASALPARAGQDPARPPVVSAQSILLRGVWYRGGAPKCWPLLSYAQPFNALLNQKSAPIRPLALIVKVKTVMPESQREDGFQAPGGCGRK